MRLVPILYSILALGLLTVPAGANDFNDRDALATLLTLDEQAPLADAEEELDRVTVLRDDALEVRDARQLDFDTADAALTKAKEDVVKATGDLETAKDDQMKADQAVMDSKQAVMDAEQLVKDAQDLLDAAMTPEEEAAALMALEMANGELKKASDQLVLDEAAALAAAKAVTTAEMALATAMTAEMQAQTSFDTAKVALDDAQKALDDAQVVVDAAQAVVDAIVAEIEGTEEFVANLSDDDVFALNRSLHNAVQTGLLPLDIDLELLELLADGGLSNREVQLATNGFESEARFNRIADRFEAKAASSGKDHFLAKADRARAKGAAMKEKFLAKVGAGEVVAEVASEAAHSAASEHARNAAGEAASTLAREGARGAAGQAARELAKQNGKPGGA